MRMRWSCIGRLRVERVITVAFMIAFVVSQGAQPAEVLAAVAALIGFLACVDALVDAEIILAGVELVACFAAEV